MSISTALQGTCEIRTTCKMKTSWLVQNEMSGQIAQVVEHRPLDREVRGSNPSHDTMALLLGRHYEFPQCGIIKETLLLLLYRDTSEIRLLTCQKGVLIFIGFTETPRHFIIACS
jgi:hypothetical protein